MYRTEKPQKQSFRTFRAWRLEVAKDWFFVFWSRAALFWFFQKELFFGTSTTFLRENNTKCARFAMSPITEDEGVGGWEGRRVGECGWEGEGVGGDRGPAGLGRGLQDPPGQEGVA